MESLDALRMNQFQCSTDNSLRTLPLSRDGFTENIKRACLQCGYAWRTPVEDVDFTDLTQWGWSTQWGWRLKGLSKRTVKKDFAKIASVQKTRSAACLTVGSIGNV